MTDRLTVDKPYGQQPETRAAAARYIVRHREDAGELLMALGLAHEGEHRRTRDIHTVGQPGDAHHTMPAAPARDAQSLAAGEREGEQ